MFVSGLEILDLKVSAVFSALQFKTSLFTVGVNNIGESPSYHIRQVPPCIDGSITFLIS
jgi:hypothetical protein